MQNKEIDISDVATLGQSLKASVIDQQNRINQLQQQILQNNEDIIKQNLVDSLEDSVRQSRIEHENQLVSKLNQQLANEYEEKINVLNSEKAVKLEQQKIQKLDQIQESLKKKLKRDHRVTMTTIFVASFIVIFVILLFK